MEILELSELCPTPPPDNYLPLIIFITDFHLHIEGDSNYELFLPPKPQMVPFWGGRCLSLNRIKTKSLEMNEGRR